MLSARKTARPSLAAGAPGQGICYLSLRATRADQIKRQRIGRRGRALQCGAQIVAREHGEPLATIAACHHEEELAVAAHHLALVELVDRRGGCAKAQRLDGGINPQLQAAGPALRADQRIGSR